MNFFIAWGVFSLLFWIGTKPISVLPDDPKMLYSESYLMPSMSFLKAEGFLQGELKDAEVIIEEILPGGLAEQLGLQTGNSIKSINNKAVSTLTLSSELAKLAPYTEHLLGFSQGEHAPVQEKSFSCAHECKLGILYQQSGDLQVLPIKFSFGGALLAGLKEIQAEWNLTMHTLGKVGKQLFSFEAGETKNAFKQLTGPVGAIKFGEKLYENF